MQPVALTANVAGGTTSSFVYDGFGRRMKKTINGTVTFFYHGSGLTCTG